VIWRTLYTALLVAALPWFLARLWWRGRRERGYRRQIGERFGWYRIVPERATLWVHAVSVGEARACAPLVCALREEFSGCDLLLTCSTAAGREVLTQLHAGAAQIVWIPYDFPGAVSRFVTHFRPRLGVLVETEIWPNLLAACRAHAVPVVLANARMSETSAAGYRRWRAIARPAFASLAAACAQGEADAGRLASLGTANVSVCGNLKFDVVPDASQARAGRAWRRALARPVLLLASTRAGEEKLLLEALARAAAPMLVVLVPRHPQRFEEVHSLLDAHRARLNGGLPVARRSKGEEPHPEHRLYLGDTMGEMAFYYAAADVAIVGGSILPLGGQNLIEACAAGTAVVFGPSMYNFSDASRLALEAGAALQAGGAQEAVQLALGLLEDAARRARMGAAGLDLCAAHRGATQRHLAICKSLVQDRSAEGLPPATAPARG